MSSSKIKPFKIQIPDSDLEDLKRRLERTRWPNELLDAGDDYGLTVDYLKPLFDYWKESYDWRQVEAELNRLPQFTRDRWAEYPFCTRYLKGTRRYSYYFDPWVANHLCGVHHHHR